MKLQQTSSNLFNYNKVIFQHGLCQFFLWISGSGPDHWWTNLQSFKKAQESIEKQCIVCHFRSERKISQPPWPCAHSHGIYAEISEILLPFQKTPTYSSWIKLYNNLLEKYVVWWIMFWVNKGDCVFPMINPGFEVRDRRGYNHVEDKINHIVREDIIFL